MKRMLPTTKKENDFTEYHAGTDLLPLQKSMIQRDEKQDEASSIACIGVWTIPQTLQATRKTVSSKNIKFSAGERNLSCFLKLKRQRPEVSNHNPPVFHENVTLINWGRKLKPPTVRKVFNCQDFWWAHRIWNIWKGSICWVLSSVVGSKGNEKMQSTLQRHWMLQCEVLH